MVQVLHGSARTTEAVRRAIQLRQESVRAAAKRYGISPTTVQKWRDRDTTADAAMGPKEPRSTVLTPQEEAVVVAFRRHTLLPLDDCLYGLQPTIPHLTRSSLHRCLERHRISRLPEVEGDKPEKKRFAQYPIGYFHNDIAQVSTEEGKLSLLVAIDRTSKFAFARLVESAGKMETAQFLRDLAAAVPYRIHIVLTDNGIQFTNRKKDTYAFAHVFDRVCAENDIEHRLTKVNHPWTNGQVERMNRTIKDATVKRYHYDSHEQLRAHLQLFVDAYNHARRLKTLRGLTPYEFIRQIWTKEPERFRLNPSHHIPGPYRGSSPRRGGTGPGGAGKDRSVPRQRYEAGRWLMETNALRAAGAFPAVSKDNEHVSYGIATHSGAVTTRDTMAPAIRRLPALDGVDRIRAGRSSRLHRVGIEAAASGSACHREPSRPRICWCTIIGSSNGKF